MKYKCINFNSKSLIINQNDKGEREEYCYSENGNCRVCRYVRECDWFLNVNKLLEGE